ncbi:Bifunctional hemolysin/adenylate cyclase precursor [compost metagenome]
MIYQSLTQQEYEELRYAFIKQVEESGHENPEPYYDTKGLITIGVGFNLHNVNTLRTFLEVAMGVSAADLERYVLGISAVLNQYQLSTSGSSMQTANMQQALSAEWRILTGNASAQFVVTNRDGNSAKELIRYTFDELIEDVYEVSLSNRLTGRGIAGLGGDGYSYERLVLLSLEYNNGGVLIGNGLLTALGNGDRFTAWYEIRFRSNGGASASGGVAKRRYMESELFGLYDDSGSVEDAEAEHVVNRFLEPSVFSSITAYESVWGSRISAANAELAILGVSNTVKVLDQIFLPISEYLYKRYAESDIEYIPTSPVIDGRVVLNFTQGSENAIQSSVFEVDGQDKNDLLISLDGPGRVLNGGLGDDILISKVAADSLSGGTGSDILMGGGGNDYLDGGEDSDYLNGGDDNDTLIGGKGNDVLLGGLGHDTYVFNSGDGLDTIVDREGHGTITYDAATLTGGAQYGDARVYKSDDKKHIYTRINDTTLVIDGQIIVQDYAEGDLGIAFSDAPSETDPQTTRDIIGDLKPIDFDPETDGIQYDYDDLDNIKTSDPDPDRDDFLFDSAGNDAITSGGGGDQVYAFRGGSDIIDAGAGKDKVYAGTGNDVIMGGADGDILSGEAGDDRIYADDKVTVIDAIAAGNTGSGSGQQGDWLAGGAGDDTLVGGTGNDALSGGGGQDLLIGGAGDDEILGDTDWVAQSFEWTVTDESGHRKFEPVTGVSIPADGAADVIYAGQGSDHVWGGAGNDVIFGEKGSDFLYGNNGNDVVSGGEGNDQLAGDTPSVVGQTPVEGDDILFGDAGNDTLFGNGGDDILVGGTGDDTLVGGEGRDIFIYNKGDGEDTIVEDNGGKPNILSFGAGFTDKDIVLRLGSLMLDLGSGDAIHIENFNKNDVFNSSTIDGFEFADGTVLTAHELLARGFDLDGTAGDDVIFGTNTTDRIKGMAGNDLLIGGDGADVLSGGSGDDVLFGEEGDDTFYGDEGNDQIQGGDGADILSGGVGDDLVFGEAGDDVLIGDDGADDLIGGEGNDLISGGNGNDLIWGETGDDTLNGDDGSDDLGGGDGADVLNGGNGNDALFGEEGNDTLDGGSGSDTLRGDNGADTYKFGRGSGKDTILNYEVSGGSIDTLEFAADVLPEDIQAFRQGDDLVFAIKDTDDSIAVKNYFVVTRSTYNSWTQQVTNYYDFQVEQVKFADGTVWTPSATPFYFSGTSGSDSTEGTSASDTFNGSLGSDYMSGRVGNDTYRFGLHSGNDRVNDAGVASDLNTILIDASVFPEDVLLSLADGDLVISLKNSPDKLTVSNYRNSSYGAYQIIFEIDGTTWSYADLFLKATEQSDQLWGRSAAEIISGLAGDDTIDGGGGSDSLFGGSGNDIITSTGSDVFIDGEEGSDYITVTGGGNKSIYGGSGNDTLSSASGYGNATITGGTGDDTYVINSVDLVIEDIDGGIDAVISDFSGYILPGHVENLALTSSAYSGTGNSLANVLIGNASNNSLSGGDGDDSLDGDAGGDSLVGGAGNDTYLFRRGSGQDTISGETDASGAADQIVFAADVLPADVMVTQDGNDLVLLVSGVSDQIRVAGYYSMSGSIEQIRFLADETIWDTAAIQAQLTAIATAGDDVLSGAEGNDLINGLGGNDSIYGYSGSDTLDGGLGNDSLIGGVGDDTYTVDSTADVVTENANEGTDTVQSSVSYTLTNEVENLTLLGSAALNGTGNAHNNGLVGNAGANTLTGAAGDDTLDGGAGGDTLVGGVGNDTYIIDTLSDVLIENANEGSDTIASSLSYTLASNFENLTLTGTAALSGTGNALANVVTGNSGDNLLDGAAGTDTLAGGAGNDTYLVDSSVDVIIENANEGTDWVQSSVSYTLSANVENLNLSGTAAISGTGNNLNNLLSGNSGNNVLSGGAGDDTYVLTAGDTVVENANEGIDTLQIATTYTLGTNVENLILTGAATISGTGNELDNVIIGNGAKNKLTGGAGDDRLEGGGGTDTLIGGAGDDYYVIDDSRDAITENANEGIDTVEAAFTYTLATNLENLTLAAGLAINGTGNSVNNVIIGNALDNILNGAVGSDTLIGGYGSDTYIVDSSNDVIVEDANEGTDLVQSSVSYSLSDNVENLTLTGAVAINGSGNSLSNTLTGNSAANLLSGGAGDDTYVIAADDSVVENANEGIDTVQSSVTFTLGANVENLTLTGKSAINGTGNDLHNILAGNSGQNVLAGGLGDDTYVIGSGDTVIENASGGTDTVQSSVTHALSDNVENLTLIGTSAVNATGNSLNNLLIGNSAANVLSGGAGDDTYVVGAGDSVVEAVDAGTDTVQSTVTFTLAANLENLILLGSAAINGTGNSANNLLVGTEGNNLLDGGVGADTMSGGLGDDTYVVDNAADLVIENSGEGTDTIQTTMSYSSGGNIENITLLGSLAINATGDVSNNLLIGNNAANLLSGGAGNDTLNGGGGSDTLVGGTGDDTYILGAAGTVIVENASEGIDTVQTATSYALMDANLENLTLTGTTTINGTGNSADNVITGNDGNNVLDGGAGSDKLYGGLGNDTLYGGAGDTLYGGAGDDLYILTGGGNAEESGGGGVDTIQSDASVDLVDYSYWSNADSSIHYVGGIENATLTGSANATIKGNDGDNVLTGNSGNNVIFSWRGNDTLSGGDGNDTLKGAYGNSTLIGGAGNDRLEINDRGSASMSGGVGDDWYYMYYGDFTGVGAKAITENTGEGLDTVEISISASDGSYTLGANIENLIVREGTAIGNELSNIIKGGAHTLSGMGGEDTLDGSTSNAQTLIGGAGGDTYIVSAGDIVIENANEGADTVQSSQTYTLGANIENLTLTGTATINGVGNSLNNILTGNTAANVLAGGQGDDTYVITANDTIVENANEGIDTVLVAGNYTLGANLENLTYTGMYNGNLTGNAQNNVLTGNAVVNLLDGGLGADTMLGGGGDDTYVVDSSADVVIENTAEGSDTIQTSVTYTASANVEKLVLTGTESINGGGNALNNTLTGNSAANVLTGGGGDDAYIVGVGDTVIENSNEGIDTVQSGVDFTLGANVENLMLTGSSSINGTGNNLDNIITGNSGGNALSGGLGDDTYVIGYGYGDTVIEGLSEGVDTVIAQGDYTLGANLENLNLAWGSKGTGNSLDNTLTGNSLSNTLDGGLGSDTLIGGTGDDTYLVDNIGDLVIESVGEGVDKVNSTVNHTLSTNVENLVLLGASAINGMGNGLDNQLSGNSAANTLTGAAGDDTLDGGAGVDTLVGGVGNDIYIIDSLGDSLTEIANEGTDTVRSTVDYTLGANFENLTLVGGAMTGIGNALNNVLNANDSSADTLAGGLGDDTYVIDALDLVTENANEGIDTIQIATSYTLGANIENLTLTGSAAINGTGNSLSNILTGNSAANVLAGGLGDDTYVIGAGDMIVENADEGVDTVLSSVGWVLSTNFENLTLSGADSISATGNSGDNVLVGNVGDNFIDGGYGSDTMIGGAGNDTYRIVAAGDSVVEDQGEGVDKVISDIDYVLGGNLEDLQLNGPAAVNGVGNELDNVLTGNTLANTLIGNAGDDTLDGGKGNDTLIGGTGNDVYKINTIGDVVIESAEEGADTVISQVDYVLGDNIENLTLVTYGAIFATGNALSNLIVGSGGDNVLDGGFGADTLMGGAGDDTYIVDNISDVVVEDPNSYGGTDTVISSISLILDAELERLTLSGVGAIDGTGNAESNILIGNVAANTLTGADGNDTLDGGAGADTLIGGAGNDSYLVDNMGDVVSEGAGAGTDTVFSSVSFVLNENLENLTLTGFASVDGTGGSGNNMLIGNIGNNSLNGGAGADTMVGNAGDDVYVVDNVGDQVGEYLDEGIDEVQSSVTYTLTPNFEMLVLTGTNAISGTGNALDNFIIGNSANNTLDGVAGSDVLQGGAGADTYILGRGYGADTVVESEATVGNADVAQFLSGIAIDQLWFSKAAGANNLEVSVIGTMDKLIVKDWYVGSANHVEQFKTADGKTLLDSQVQNLVDAMAAFAPPAFGETTLSSDYRAALDSVISVNWQ